MSANLITRERAQRNIAQSSFTASDNLLLDALIAAASDHIQRWCDREFPARQYDEVYDGHGQEILLLRHYPIISVDRLAYNPRPALRVRNTSSANQRATVRVSDTGLTLTRAASGTTTVNELTFAGNTTLTALASAIDALGNGWDAELTASAYGGRASADLRPQGVFQAKDNFCELQIHLDELFAYEIDIRRGWLFRSGDEGWDGGPGYWRVIYTAGYSTVPEDVQEACAELTAALYWQARRDPGLTQEGVPGVVTRAMRADLPATAKTLLAPYRRREV